MKSKINFLGLSFEAGQELRGLRLSPNEAKSYFSHFHGLNIEIIDHGTITSDIFPSKINTLKQLKKFEWKDYQKAYWKIEELLAEDSTLLNWGGDHSVGLSTVGAFSTVYPNGYVLWIDAHADLNLPEVSPTGNLHGMPLSILLNLNHSRTEYLPWIRKSLLPEKLIYIGVRDLDPFEKMMINDLNIKIISAEDIRNRGMKSVADEIFKIVEGHPLHVSFDIDSVSPEFAPSTGVPVKNGINAQDLETLARILSQHQNIKSVDTVEINPTLGSENDVAQTYKIAFNFLTLLFQGGKNAWPDRSIEKLNTASME